MWDDRALSGFLKVGVLGVWDQGLGWGFKAYIGMIGSLALRGLG